MTAFIALYKGETVAGARLVALTADPSLVRDFATRLVTDDPQPEEDRRDGLRLVEEKEKPSPDSPAKSDPSRKGVHKW